MDKLQENPGDSDVIVDFKKKLLSSMNTRIMQYCYGTVKSPFVVSIGIYYFMNLTPRKSNTKP